MSLSLCKRCGRPCPIKFDKFYCSSNCRDWTAKKQKELDRRKAALDHFDAIHGRFEIVNAGVEVEEVPIIPEHPPLRAKLIKECRDLLGA